MSTLAAMLVALFGMTALVLFVIYVFVPLVGLVGSVFSRVFRFIGGEFSDAARFVGALITAIVFVPMALASVVFGRWSASAHYLRASRDELAAAASCLYRFFIGRPAWLVGLSGLTEGLERRMPEVIARAPGADAPRGRSGRFEGYTVVGSLPPGGSGARLYIAEPDDRKRAAFDALGRHGVGRVIIKSFSLREGSSLPQIVRESRALEAAKNIGLVLEHELTDQRFHYVMPYVPGDDLSTAIRRLHEQSASEGLDSEKLRRGLGYARDLVDTLARYHRAGLWHKDVKPDNIIVHDGRAHLVDLGLVTPLRSAMTLTTHGTEYFRDPELVRMALRGVKVHQVSGEKFDVYAAGAVLYSIIENSFPAHGGLSQISRRCPESVRWIVRRAMAEYDKRYVSAGEMLDDLRAVLEAESPEALAPAALPSMRHGAEYEPETPVDELAGFEPLVRAAGAAERGEEDDSEVKVAGVSLFGRGPGGARRSSAEPRAAGRPSPSISVVNWWTGRYRATEAPGRHSGSMEPEAAGVAGAPRPAVAALPLERRDSAAEQLRRARERVRTRRKAAQRHRRTRGYGGDSSVFGRVVGAVVVLGLIMLAGGLAVQAVTDDGELAARGGERAPAGTSGQAELSHHDESFSIEANANRGLVRITEADGRTYELSLDAELIRDAAERWPQAASEWRRAFLSDILPAMAEARANRERGPPVPGDGAPAVPRVPEIPEIPEIAFEWMGEAPRPAGPWLLVDQLGAAVSDEDRARVDRKLASPAFGPVEWITADKEPGLDLVSRAIATIGIGTPSDPETRTRLRRLLGELEQVEGLVWLYEADGPRALAIASEATAERGMRRALRDAR